MAKNSALNLMLVELMDSDGYSDSASESEDDYELEVIMWKCLKVPRLSINNYFEEVVAHYNDEEFIRHFRINKLLFNNLREEYANSTLYREMLRFNPNTTIPADKSLAIFLWFAAHEGCTYVDISDRFNVAVSTVHLVIIRLVVFLSNLASREIRWPTTQQMAEEASKCEADPKCRIPGVIGCVDGTHIAFHPPKSRKDEYLDRKGIPSLHVQATCDSRRKFINICIGFPGSVHDSRVFNASSLKEKLNTLPEGYRILGDSGYPCLKSLLVPYRNDGHLTRAKTDFNKALSHKRIEIEHAFGILKQRFRQLYHCKLRGIKTLCHFIRACMVLHNMSNSAEFSDEVVIDEEEVRRREDEYRDDGDDAEGVAVRDIICNSLFSVE